MSQEELIATRICSFYFTRELDKTEPASAKNLSDCDEITDLLIRQGFRFDSTAP